MDFRHLLAFYTAANEMHVTRAAKRLKIAQPALTRQIRALERGLGCQLVKKDGRGITLTQAGIFLHAEAGGLLQAFEAVRRRTAAIGAGLEGHLAVGLSEGAAFTPRLSECLMAFRKTHPDLEITFTQRRSAELGSALEQGEVDVAFTCPVSTDDGRFSTRTLSKDKMLLAVPRTHTLAGKHTVSLSALKGEPLLLVSHGDFPESFEETVKAACKRVGFSPRFVQTSPELILALNLTAAGVGLAFAPEYMKATRRDALAYVRVESPVPLEAHLVIVSRMEDKDLPLIKALRQTALQCFGRQGEGTRKLGSAQIKHSAIG